MSKKLAGNPSMSKRLSRACGNCRRKKVRCDGAYPQCKGCKKSSLECVYATPPLQSYVVRDNKEAEVIKLLTYGNNFTTAIGHAPVYQSQATSEYKQAARIKLEAKSKICAQQFHEIISTRDHSELLRELFRYTIDLVYPYYMLPYMPTFVEGLINANGSPGLFNKALFKVTCYLGFRFLPPDILEKNLPYLKELREDAQTELAMSITHEASVATATAFVLQSIHDMVYGKTSLAWTYSGIAFRMAVDLGIHHPAENLKRLPDFPEEYEMRQRLWWSCFVWDKLISLYMGRMPIFPSVHPDMPMEFCEFFSLPPAAGLRGEVYTNSLRVDNYSDTESWAESQRPSYSISCFFCFCKLSMIISDIMVLIYANPSNSFDHRGRSSGSSKYITVEQFKGINQRLEEFWNSLPPHLNVLGDGFTADRSPPHIIGMNFLYHATIILYLRPFLSPNSNASNSPEFRRCLAAAKAIEDLLRLFIQFSYRFTYTNVYCIYIAATVRIHEIAVTNCGITPSLEFFIKTLSDNPSLQGITKCLQLIKEHMKHYLPEEMSQSIDGIFKVPNISIVEVVESGQDVASILPLPAFIGGSEENNLGFNFVELDNYVKAFLQEN